MVKVFIISKMKVNYNVHVLILYKTHNYVYFNIDFLKLSWARCNSNTDPYEYILC